MPELISEMIANKYLKWDRPFEIGLIHQRSVKLDDLREQIQLPRYV
jgi:hypothetical protein